MMAQHDTCWLIHTIDSTLPLWGVLTHVNKLLEYRTDLLVTRVFRAENVHATFPSNDAAAVAHDFDGRANFHASGEGRCHSLERRGSREMEIRDGRLGLGQSCP